MVRWVCVWERQGVLDGLVLMSGGGWDVNVFLVYEQAGKVGRWCLGRMYSRAA